VNLSFANLWPLKFFSKQFKFTFFLFQHAFKLFRSVMFFLQNRLQLLKLSLIALSLNQFFFQILIFLLQVLAWRDILLPLFELSFQIFVFVLKFSNSVNQGFMFLCWSSSERSWMQFMWVRMISMDLLLRNSYLLRVSVLRKRSSLCRCFVILLVINFLLVHQLAKFIWWISSSDDFLVFRRSFGKKFFNWVWIRNVFSLDVFTFC
jgi:hypothetical protein